VKEDSIQAEREVLRGLLSAFLEGRLGFGEFYQQFYFRFADNDDLTPESLGDRDWSFLSGIHEKLDFVAESPDAISRRDGWVSSDEFKKWLGELLRRQDGST
jgi:hypothetical protein